MVSPHCHHPVPCSQQVYPRFLGAGALWIGQFVPAVPVVHILLCLFQVFQYRSWCQELEKRLEAIGVSEAVPLFPLSSQ